ncbi:arginine/serine-rich protein 1 isoform X1 [Melanotaenia boesemani]|uniref:arginine/serine-rich protein 1 isoform X1 n=1 Tax=Melanotaenia boesemani TaxID=1250792 RepID=UPI001C03FF05|nr:arginine/serine-rich protein 1 isoform X1 [Melanotaenia boesemani]
MAKRPDSEMAQARQTDGLNVIFDQESPSSARSRSRSTSGSGSSSSRSGHYRGGRRGRHRSSSSSSSHTSSSSTSSSRTRSRSRPRCHRRSSRCGCVDHGRYSRGHRRSPPRRYRAHSRSYSRSASRDRYTRHGRSYRSRSRSRSRSSGRWSRYRRPMSHFRSTFSRSPSRAYRGRSRSRSPGHSVSLSVNEKRKLLEAAKVNAMNIMGVEKLELPESVKPILSEQSESRRLSPEPINGVRQGSKKTKPQDTEEDPEESSPKRSPRGKIAFSINNSVAKPTVVGPSSAKVTPRVDSYESRKPYGHWIPIGSGQTSSACKRT